MYCSFAFIRYIPFDLFNYSCLVDQNITMNSIEGFKWSKAGSSQNTECRERERANCLHSAETSQEETDTSR